MLIAEFIRSQLVNRSFGLWIGLHRVSQGLGWEWLDNSAFTRRDANWYYNTSSHPRVRLFFWKIKIIYQPAYQYKGNGGFPSLNLCTILVDSNLITDTFCVICFLWHKVRGQHVGCGSPNRILSCWSMAVIDMIAHIKKPSWQSISCIVAMASSENLTIWVIQLTHLMLKWKHQRTRYFKTSYS